MRIHGSAENQRRFCEKFKISFNGRNKTLRNLLKKGEKVLIFETKWFFTNKENI